MIAISAVCIFVMIILVILDYKQPVYKEFGLDNFYVGYEGTEGDPKSAWEAINGTGVIGKNACDTVMKVPQAYEESPAKVCGRYTWLKLGDAPDKSSLSNYYSGDNSVLKPYEQDDYIIAPARLVFRNSNVDQSLVSAEDGIYIEAYAGAEYVIRWSNVYCWYCHIGKENVNKHTDVLGYGGSNRSTTAGYVIGVANKDTTVSLYMYNSNGNLTAASWNDFYFKYTSS